MSENVFPVVQTSSGFVSSLYNHFFVKSSNFFSVTETRQVVVSEVVSRDPVESRRLSCQTYSKWVSPTWSQKSPISEPL